MSHLRELTGKSWHEWPQTQLVEDMDALSPSPATSSCSTSITPTSSRSHSPRSHVGGHHVMDDVMKLPRRDMHIFGHCPVQDDFVLVVCDTCNASVKIEAFASHVRLRHGQRSSSSTMASSSASSHSGQGRYTTKACSVDLLKEDIFSLSSKPILMTPTVVVPLLLVAVPSAAVVIPEVPDEVIIDDIMDVDDEDVKEIKLETLATADETIDIKTEDVSNVISIPDTDPLPHGMMSNDLMAMVGEATTPPSSHHQVLEDTKTPPLIRLQVKSEGDSSSLTTLLLNKKMSPLKVTSSLSVSASASASAASNRIDRKPMREYHPDKHCGVWDADTKRHCTRALTCKSHSVLLKRKIDGRSRPFDELVAAHKKAQAEAAAKAIPAAASSSSVVTTTPIHIRSFATPTVSVTAPVASAVVRTLTPHPPSPALVHHQTSTGPTKEMIISSLEESLHYTTDHPRPLAICGFRGGRRVGGLIVTGRNHVFTRKLVRVAITAGTAASFGGAGFHRIRPRVLIGPNSVTASPVSDGLNSPQGSYVLNYSLGGNLKRQLSSGGGLNLTTLPPGGVVIPESFKTDIQDFKGGIKFELGRKIKHILPSGSEVTK